MEYLKGKDHRGPSSHGVRGGPSLETELVVKGALATVLGVHRREAILTRRVKSAVQTGFAEKALRWASKARLRCLSKDDSSVATGRLRLMASRSSFSSCPLFLGGEIKEVGSKH